ncbi:TIGR02452 family protein [Pilimelia columellifera]
MRSMNERNSARRDRLRAIARETLDIVASGGYRHQGAQVDLAGAIGAALAGVRLHRPDEVVHVDGAARAARVQVTAETTLAAARRLGPEVACLVFASAKNPGGGFRDGAEAQEESVVRSSALYPCLNAAAGFYRFHERQRDLRYSDHVIYSPRVPVFRDDHGTLLPQPYPASFLTAAAPNISALRRSQPWDVADVPRTLRRRAAHLLRLAAAHRHRSLVLGAWGCGVFGNDPAEVAAAFDQALQAAPWFDEVVFAVHDTTPGARTRQAFVDRFAGQVSDV